MFKQQCSAIEVDLHESCKFIETNFNKDLMDDIIAKKKLQLDQRLHNVQGQFRLQNIRNAPKPKTICMYFGDNYFLSGYFEYYYKTNNIAKYVTDDHGDFMHQNCIAITNDNILLNNQDIISADNNINIINILGTDLTDNTDIPGLKLEISENGPAKICINIKDEMYKLNVETLIALQIAHIKLVAEKQLGNNLRKALFTVPSDFTMRKINAVKCAGKLVEFDQVSVINDITAIAIAYAIDVKLGTEK
ncbi:unnamed protein product [Oppiella nova]|uniref:Uncharacterized protein n=1 Tax=Oppiella nova TaxID=334625 RepID=A0A7R9LGN3_9ACAR|nr:unnamed protein product [Oppiella nova]CAG2163495.1 unnamed protein product [Oppiella nova]